VYRQPAANTGYSLRAVSIDDLLRQRDALGLAELVRTKEVSALELVDAAIARIDAHDGALGAVIHRLDDQARAAAQGPLPDGPFCGVPFVVKDFYAACTGAPLENGSRFFAGHVSDHDSELVARYRRAGVVIVGKTNTPEFGITPFTEPELHGKTSNPWALDRTSGGSSGGAAAAVAARMVPMAHAGDGGGSIRIPASCCGVFGLKPTRGRTPVGPDATEAWHGFAIQHVITRSVRDSAAMLDATAGYEIGGLYDAPPHGSFLDATKKDPETLRIGFTLAPHLPGVTHADCEDAVQSTIGLLEELGHCVEAVKLDLDGEQFARDYLLSLCSAIATSIELAATALGRAATRHDFEARTWVMRTIGRGLSSVDLGLALERLRATGRRIAPLFERYDVLVTPTLALPPVRHGSLDPQGAQAFAQRILVGGGLSGLLRFPGLIDQLAKRVYAFTPFTMVWNVTGQPSMSVPLHWNRAGLPIGTMFTTRFGDEATLFALAASLERARPWAERMPTLPD
jgi:amidase